MGNGEAHSVGGKYQYHSFVKGQSEDVFKHKYLESIIDGTEKVKKMKTLTVLSERSRENEREVVTQMVAVDSYRLRKKKRTKSEFISLEEELFFESKDGNLEAVKNLLEDSQRQVDINWKNGQIENATALHAAAYENHTDIMEYLISKGANVSQGDKQNRQALHVASHKGSIDACITLLSFGAGVNDLDTYGHTPINLALKGYHFELAKTLRLSGADVNIKTGNGYHILHEAAKTGDVKLITFLLENQEDFKLLLNPRDEQKKTPLMKAIECGHRGIVQLLLSNKKTDLNILSGNGQNIFHIAVNADQSEMLELIATQFDQNKLKELIDEGDHLGLTPLHLAVKRTNYDCVRLLMSWKCNPKRENHAKKTALAIAVELGDKKIVDLLKKKH